jgi:acyl-CoA synthetase (NDP forming)
MWCCGSWVGSGFRGVVYSISGEREAVEGVAAYPSLEALPAAPDVVLLCAAPASVEGQVGACVEHGVAGVVVLTGAAAGAGREAAALGRLVARRRRGSVGCGCWGRASA